MEYLFTLFCVLSSFLPAFLPSFSLPSLSLPSCLPPSFSPPSYPSIHPSLLPPSLSTPLSFFFLLSVNLDSGIFILHFGLWSKALFKYLFNKFYFFKGSFKFPAKLNKRWTEFSHTLCPHTNIASLTINITHQRGTCIINNETTMAHDYYSKSILYTESSFLVLCILWILSNVLQNIFIIIVSYE